MPAILIAKTVSRFQTDVTVTKDDVTVQGRSAFDLIMLGAAQGTTIVVTAAGPQAKDVIEALTVLVNSGFNADYGISLLPAPKEHAEWLDIPPASP